MSKYWKASKELAEFCRNALETEHEAFQQALKLSRKHGGSRTKLVYRRVFGERIISGFSFTGEPDTKTFKRMKDVEGGWEPRLSTKAGKALRNQLNEFTTDAVARITDQIGMDQMYGLHLRTPGIRIIGDDVYFELPDDVTPRDCERVSDVEFERILESEGGA